MLRMRLYRGCKSLEKYLNEKSKKGYFIETINSFGLFEPLRIDVYRFEKTVETNRIYRVDSRKVAADELSEYKQIFFDDGWKYFGGNHANDNFNVDHVFYANNIGKYHIFSDEQSERERNRYDAKSSLYKAIFLSITFACFSIFLPSINSGSSNTIFGFILHNLYFIVAIVIMVSASVKYYKNR